MKLFLILAFLFVSTYDSLGQNSDIDSRLTRMDNATIYDNVCSSLQDKSGNLWFGTTCEGVFCYIPSAGTFTHFTEKDGLSDDRVSCIYEDLNGTLWFGTQNGVCKYDGKTFVDFPINGSLLAFPVDSSITFSQGAMIASPNWITGILQDQDGNFWLSSYGSGVYHYNHVSMKIFTEKEGLCYNYIEQALKDHSGKLWFATRGGGLSSYDGKSFTNLVADDIKYNHIHSFLEDHTGNIWIGTVNGSIRRYDPTSGTFTNFTWKDGFASTNATCMLEDKKGNLWFGTDDQGVCKYDGKSFSNLTTKDGLCSNRIWSILEDSEGNIWFGTRNVGLCRYNPITGIVTDFSDPGNK